MTQKQRHNHEDKELLYGKHAVRALKDLSERVCHLYLQADKESREKSLVDFAKAHGISCTILDKEGMARLLKENAQGKHQGMAALMKPVPTIDLDEWARIFENSSEPALVLVLDHLQDPQNMGAIIRTAEVAGAQGVFFPRKRGVLPTEAVVRASAGAALRVPLVSVVNVSRAVQELQKKGFWTVALEPTSERTLWKNTSFPEKLALVLGSEGKGLSRLVKENCDESVALPMKGTTGSLNVSVAAAVGIFEWMRVVGQE